MKCLAFGFKAFGIWSLDKISGNNKSNMLLTTGVRMVSTSEVLLIAAMQTINPGSADSLNRYVRLFGSCYPHKCILYFVGITTTLVKKLEKLMLAKSHSTQ